MRDRIDDLEAEVKRLGANTNDNEDEEEKLAEIKKDIDFIMGRGDPEADAISGIPTLVRNLSSIQTGDGFTLRFVNEVNVYAALRLDKTNTMR